MLSPSNSGTTPFRYWIFDNWFNPLTREELDQALIHHWQVSYDNDVERGKSTSRDFDAMLPALRTAFIKLRHPDTVEEFKGLMGVPTLTDDPIAHGAGLHLSTYKSFLQAHVDYQRHPHLPDKERRLNAILFMHDRWEKEWGGDLLLCDMNGKAIVEIEPKPGRLTLFECGSDSMHGVRVIKEKQAVRLSCAVYYLADTRATATRTRAMFLPNRSRGGVPVEVA